MSTPQCRRADNAFPSTSGAMPDLEWWTGEAWSTLRLRDKPSWSEGDTEFLLSK
jgi:hypothetical protein